MEATFNIINEKILDNCRKAIALGYVVEIKKKRKTRQQEKYLHAIINIIAKDQGVDPEDLKDDLKIPVLGFTEHTYAGKTYLRAKSSRGISDEQYGKLIDAALMMANFLNITLPPKQYFGMEF